MVMPLEIWWFDKYGMKKYSVRHPLDGDPPEIFQIFNYKEVTCEKVARADLVVAMRSTNEIGLHSLPTRPS